MWYLINNSSAVSILNLCGRIRKRRTIYDRCSFRSFIIPNTENNSGGCFRTFQGKIAKWTESDSIKLYVNYFSQSHFWYPERWVLNFRDFCFRFFFDSFCPKCLSWGSWEYRRTTKVGAWLWLKWWNLPFYVVDLVSYPNNGEDRNDVNASWEDCTLRKRVKSVSCKVMEQNLGKIHIPQALSVEKWYK